VKVVEIQQLLVPKVTVSKMKKKISLTTVLMKSFNEFAVRLAIFGVSAPAIVSLIPSGESS